jgi:hypothetical protein
MGWRWLRWARRGGGGGVASPTARLRALAMWLRVAVLRVVVLRVVVLRVVVLRVVVLLGICQVKAIAGWQA